MRVDVRNSTRAALNLPRRPHLRRIPKANINDTRSKYFGTFAAHPGQNYTSKRCGTREAPRLRGRYHKMVDEAKVPMETDEESFGSSQISAGTKVAGELNQLVDEMVEELEHKLSAVSAEIMAKMDDMSRRLDNLEASIQAQNNQAANPS